LQTKNIGDLEPIRTSGNAPVSAQEYELAQKDPAYGKFLEKKWTIQQQFNAPYKSAEQERQDIENAYKYGTPPSPVPAGVSVTAGGKTYYFPDQKRADAFKKQAGVK
jgi:hypothetical protein